MSEEYSVGYEAGYQDGWNAAVEQPVRTKDLTEYELDELRFQNLNYFDYARAVIAADREKNRG